MNKYKLILPISIVLGCLILGGFYYAVEMSNKKTIEKQATIKQEEAKSKYKDEIALVSKLSEDFEKASQLNKETNIPIYSKDFPGYKREFVDLEEKWDKQEREDISDRWYAFNKKREYASENQEYAVYYKAQKVQGNKMKEWLDVIRKAKIESSALLKLVKSEDISEDYKILVQYAEAANNFWEIERLYWIPTFGFRTEQLDKALERFEMQKKVDPFPDDYEQQEKAASIQMAILQNKIKDILN